MKVVRRGTFETNSSSCHSVTIFKNGQDWEDFKNHKVYINREMYDIEEHTERINVINEENHDDYIVNIDRLYDTISEIFMDTDRLHDNYYSQYNDKDMYIFNYLKKNMSKDLLMKILVSKADDVICELNPPIKVTYNYGSKRTYVYDKLETCDFYDFLFGYGRFSEEIPDFYVYGDGHEWDDAMVKRYVDEDTGERIVVVSRDEEC